MKVVRQDIQAMLDDLVRSRSRSGEFDWAELVPDVADFLRRAIDEGEMAGEELLYDLARRLTSDYMRGKSPQTPGDPNQLSLFYDPEAVLTLGDREVILMAEARAQHLERHRTVLTTNFEAQASAYFGWTRYIDDRLPQLRERDCTLNIIEEEIGSISDEAA